jgi:ABC-type nickel/cobalt efflux system permease component RcnA
MSIILQIGSYSLIHLMSFLICTRNTTRETTRQQRSHARSQFNSEKIQEAIRTSWNQNQNQLNHVYDYDKRASGFTF